MEHEVLTRHEPQQQEKPEKGFVWKGYIPYCTKCGEPLQLCLCDGEQYPE